MIIYKHNSVWGMQFIGGQSTMRLYQILSGIGALGSHCVAAVNQGRQHLFATGSDDLIVFDGQNPESILEKKWKKYLSKNVDDFAKARSFVFAIERNTEAWFCYAEKGHLFPNMALIWNWRDNTISQKAFDTDIAFAAIGPIDNIGDVWDADTATWDSDTSAWDALNFDPKTLSILGAFPVSSTGQLSKLDASQQNNGVDYSASVARTDIALIGQDRISGTFKADFENRKLMKRIWPRVEGAAVQVSVGSQETLGGGVDWSDSQTFTPGVDTYLDFLVNGRLIAVKFESSIAGTWILDGYDMEIEPLGNL